MRIWVVAVATMAALSCGCAHYFDGVVAELDERPGLSVIRSQSSYGDCFREDKPVSVIYGIDRAAYQLRIVHGVRYWPELFLVANAPGGGHLRITGEQIRPATTPFVDLRSILKARDIEVTHFVSMTLPPFWDEGVRKNLAVEAVAAGKIGPMTVAFNVQDSANQVVGRETLSFRLHLIRCREIDGL